MFKKKRTALNQAAAISMFILGLVLVIISLVNGSSLFVNLGVALLFWGFIIFYLMPTKHVPITMLYAEAEVNASNIERIINESGKILSGIYLPPRKLEEMDSSLVIIPQDSKETLLLTDEITNSLTTDPKDSVLIVPPGAGFCRLFEHELNASFERWDLKQLRVKLPKLLVEDLELVENVEIQIQENTVILDISGSILDEFCRYMDSKPRTHKQVGCILSSAIACALAKASGKFVTIQSETRNQEAKTTHIEYQISEGKPLQPESTQSPEEHLQFNIALPSLTVPDVDVHSDYRIVRTSLSENSDLNILGIEIDPNALDYLKRNGDVFVLTDVEIPEDSSCRIKGYAADVIVKFEEFVIVCKTHDDSQTGIDSPRTEFTTKVFGLQSQTKSKPSNLGSYVAKSGFSSVDDWLGTLKTADENPECSTRHKKLFLIYHIQYQYQILAG